MPDECSVFDQYDVRAVIGGYRLLEFVAQKHKWSVYDKDGTPRGSFMQRANAENLIAYLLGLEAASQPQGEGGSK